MGPTLPPTPVIWKRDGRLSRSLVGPGHLELSDGRLLLQGRRTGPLRSLMVLSFWALSPLLALGGVAAVTLTGIGLSWRHRDAEWLGWAALGYLLVLLGTLAFGALLRRILEPPARVELPWTALTALRSDGWTVELQAPGLIARARPRPYSRTALEWLRGLRDAPPLPRPRSRHLDQAATLAVLVLLAAAVAEAHRRRPPSPLPARLSPAERDAFATACPLAEGAPALRNRWEEGRLRSEVEGEPGPFRLQAASWRPGEALRPLSCGADCPLGEGEVGLSLLVQGAAPVAGGLEEVLCSGRVGRFDIARAPAPEGPQPRLRRVGDDLEIAVEGPARGLRLLVAREPTVHRLDLLDPCELAIHEGRPRLLPAEDQRLANFFEGSAEGARVWLLRPAALDALPEPSRAARRCAELDALAWTGRARGPSRLAEARPPLRERAADLLRAQPIALPGQDHDAVVASVRAAHRLARGRLAPGSAEQRAFQQGFLDGLPWGRLLDRLSMQQDLPQFERIRQQLSGEDPEGVLGELFLLRLAEELLARAAPTPSTYDERIDLALAWRAVEPGQTWEAHGRTVRVPSREVADYYGVVGHYLLVDLGRRVERRMSEDLGFRLTGLPLRWRLAGLGIDLDIEKSSGQKALEAWVTGDFEYLGDRALAKLREEVADPGAAIEKASAARYRLDEQWAARDGRARTAWLQRDGQRIGWVGLYDASRVRAGFQAVNGEGFTRGREDLVALAGSYVTSQGRTAGLSARQGRVENFLISSGMGGLVAFDRQGRVHLLDMRGGGRLPGLEGPIRPLERLADLHALIRWIEDNGASAFQTHLLGADGRLVIDEGKASAILRERHLLVQAAHQGRPILAIVDLPGTPPVSLYEAAVIAVQALRTPERDGGPGLDVIGIANLDVGSYNALQAWDEGGRTLNRCPVELGATMNLVRLWGS